MTQTSNTAHELNLPRRRIVIARAFDYVTRQNFSETYKQALLGETNTQRKSSTRPRFLRLYFAERARHFPISNASRAMAQQQEMQRAMQKKARADERAQRHAMPEHLKAASNAEQRHAWIQNRILRTGKNPCAMRLAAE